MRHIVLLFAAVLIAIGCQAQPEASATRRAPGAAQRVQTATTDAQRQLDALMSVARREEWHRLPLGEVMQQVGLYLKGRPYVAGVLESGTEETLVCRLDGFDCVSLVETTLALARGIVAQDYSMATFQRNLENARYRNGRRSGYCSRLHYWSDWVADNSRRGNVQNLTRQLGGIPLDARLDFMSRNRDKYPLLADNDSLYACIQDVEHRLEGMQIYYIPKARVRQVYDRLQAGDIIATATSIGGLDVTHTGLVYDEGGTGRGFLHASPQGGVKVSPDLYEYLQKNTKQIGILVIRPLAAAN